MAALTLLHTSDWHVGKTIRGLSRNDEHRAVLAEIVDLADEHAVDIVLVAGDLFETAAPTPESEEIVYRALLDLADTGATIALIAGNHDNARRLRAVSPLLELGRVNVMSEIARPDEGGVRLVRGRSGDEARIAFVPFVSQRGMVRADELMAREAFEHAQIYADRLLRVIAALAAGFDAAVPNVVLAHAYVAGGAAGGGERPAHLVEEYAVPALAFPASAAYVALGHLHRAQQLAGATAIYYCGSPLQLDFGETDQAKSVNLVTVDTGVPARVRSLPLTAGRALHTLRGTVDEIQALGDALSDDCWLRVVVEGPSHAGLGDQVRRMLGERVVEVRVDAPVAAGTQARPSRKGRSPTELFAEYCAEQNMVDERVAALFGALLDEHLDASAGPVG